nr:Uma2 family endonuclease [Actinomadura rayongensis]
MFERAELHDFLRVAGDDSRVEIIGGVIDVSPAPTRQHAVVVDDILHAFTHADVRGDSSGWHARHGTNLRMADTGDGHIPDLMVFDSEIVAELDRSGKPTVYSNHVEVVGEVTSPRNARRTRKAAPKAGKPTKWNTYAQVGVPYYLLIDRDPKVARTFLYSLPDSGSSAYLDVQEWEFGKTVHLPEPFDIDIDTSNWTTW